MTDKKSMALTPKPSAKMGVACFPPGRGGQTRVSKWAKARPDKSFRLPYFARSTRCYLLFWEEGAGGWRENPNGRNSLSTEVFPLPKPLSQKGEGL